MGILGYIVIGLIAGSIAGAIMKSQSSMLVTIIIGIIGSIVGGFLGNLLFSRPITEFWSIYTWLMAILGSVIVIFIWNRIQARR